MNWFRRRPTNSRSNDPFQFLNVASPQNLVVQTASRELERSRRQLYMIGIILALTLLVIAFLISFKLDLSFSTKSSSYAYLEMKIIDQNGRPVAGASVSREGEQIGVSDSFGEWRRYLEVTLGESMTLDLVKQRGQDIFKASKEIKIPNSKPTSGDIEIFSSVQLVQTEAEPASEIAPVTPAVKDMNSSAVETVAEKADRKTEVQFNHLQGDIANSHSYINAKNQILGFVNKFIKQDNGKFNHNCDKLKMSYIPYESTHGFIEVTCHGAQNWSVLRNIEASKKLTAEKIFQAMYQTARMVRTDRSPVGGWQKLSLVFTGNLPAGSRIYVSGYPAQATKEGYWSYWGQRNGRANLSIVNQNHIEYRQRITNNPMGARYINLPHRSIARQ